MEYTLRDYFGGAKEYNEDIAKMLGEGWDLDGPALMGVVPTVGGHFPEVVYAQRFKRLDRIDEN